MRFLNRLLGDPTSEPESLGEGIEGHWTVPNGDGTDEDDPQRPGTLRVSIFVGGLTEAPTDGICTSTNPRLSLMGGTGAAVLQRAGWAVKRECESILEAEREETGRESLRVGSARITTAGALPFEGIVHCVASDDSHRSSPEIVRRSVRSALARAGEAGWDSLAMPPFGTGHAHLDLERALEAMARELRTGGTAVRGVVLVLQDPSTVPQARRILDRELTNPPPPPEETGVR